MMEENSTLDDQFPEGRTAFLVIHGICWVNFYDDKDAISGHLGFCSVEENVKVDLGMKWGHADVGFWDFDGFYSDIAKRSM